MYSPLNCEKYSHFSTTTFLSKNETLTAKLFACRSYPATTDKTTPKNGVLKKAKCWIHAGFRVQSNCGFRFQKPANR